MYLHIYSIYCNYNLNLNNLDSLNEKIEVFII